MKTCSTCSVSKPAASFYARRDRPCGLQSQCKECTAATVRSSHARLAQRPNIVNPEHKTCSKCKREQPGSAFSTNRSALDGLHSQCKDCTAAADRTRGARLAKRVSIAVPSEKTCPKCKREQPGSAFSKNRGQIDGLESHCKDCQAVTKRARGARLAQRASVEVPSEKTCPKCKRTQLAAAFSPERRELDGLRSHCKECQTASGKAYQARNAARSVILNPVEKKCSKCKAVLPAAEFFKDLRTVSGLIGACRKCCSANFNAYVRGTHGAKYRAAVKRYRATPAGRVTARLNHQRRRARLQDSCSPGVTRKQWLEILELFGGRCGYCLEPASTIDHIIPLAAGGLDEPSNVVPACVTCNSSKCDLSLLSLLLQPTRLVTSRMFSHTTSVAA